jgi:hypothetical protein
MNFNKRDNLFVLDHIPVQIDTAKVIKRMKLRESNRNMAETIAEIINTVSSVVNPKAAYRAARVQVKYNNTVEMEGVTFSSHVLSANLEQGQEVFPSVITTGKEIENIEFPDSDLRRKYCLDIIKEIVLSSAISYLESYLKQHYQFEFLSYMSPGELPSWPLAEQQNLFELLGNVEKYTGVQLNQSNMMQPEKSRSAIYFSSSSKFLPCLLCRREKCDGRKASFDPVLSEKYRLIK